MKAPQNYSGECEDEALEMGLSQGLPIIEAAHRLDMSKSILRIS